MTRLDPEIFYNGYEQMREILHAAWQKNFLSGYSGNASLILADNNILITTSGSAKGRLKPQNLCIVTRSGELLAGAPPSSEAKMHYALYAARHDCQAILHTHPPKMLTLGIKIKDSPNENFLDLPLYEAGVFRKMLAIAPKGEPGSQNLAEDVANAAKNPAIKAIWMTNHGLCCLGKNLSDALALSEEMEHLARIQLALI